MGHPFIRRKRHHIPTLPSAECLLQLVQNGFLTRKKEVYREVYRTSIRQSGNNNLSIIINELYLLRADQLDRVR